MSATAKITSALAALALTATALAGCSATAPAAVETPVASASPIVASPSPAVAEPAAEADTCSRMSEVYGSAGGLYQERQGTLRDFGAREYARGDLRQLFS